MEICGFNSSSDAGPDNFGCSIFLKGCNLRCPYCMNSALVIGNMKKNIPIEEVIKKIREDNPEWVFISGGEPSYSDIDELNNMVELLKGTNKKIGISTNGTNTNLYKIIKYINYIALDIKGNVNVYDKIGNGRFGSDLMINVLNTWYFLREVKWFNESFGFNKSFDYEIRSTVYPDFVNKEFVDFIGQFFLSNEKWVFQVYRPTNDMLDKTLDPKDSRNYEEITKDLADYAKNKYKDVNISIRFV